MFGYEEEMLANLSALDQNKGVKPISYIALILVALIGSASNGTAQSAKDHPVLLYSRYFNAPGENRYLPDGNFNDVLDLARKEFQVQVHARPLTAETLAGVNVVLIANPSDKGVGTNLPPHHFNAQDIAALKTFVEKGGGLIIMSNQENHNLDTDDTNQLLGQFGLAFKNVYTDAKQLVLPKDLPVFGGLRWAYYTGNQVKIESGHPAKPRALFSNDLAQKPPKGKRDEAGALAAVAEPGMGRVIAITDSGWLTADALSGKGIGEVAIKDHDNWEIFRRMVRWAGHSPM